MESNIIRRNVATEHILFLQILSMVDVYRNYGFSAFRKIVFIRIGTLNEAGMYSKRTHCISQLRRNFTRTDFSGLTYGSKLTKISNFQLLPNTFFSISVVRAAGFCRIFNSSFAIMINKPLMALSVAYAVRSGFCFETKGIWL